MFLVKRAVLWQSSLILLLLCAASISQPLDGQWQSSTGAQVVLRTSRDNLSVTVTPLQGAATRWSGRWLRKWDLFDYHSSNGKLMTGEAINSDKIVVRHQGSPDIVWTRLVGSSQPQTQPQPQPQYPTWIQGRWSTTSGHTADLTTQNDRVFLKVYASNGQHFSGEGRWISGQSFRFSYTGYPGQEWVATTLKDGRLKVAGVNNTSNSKVNYWSKI